jgi:hypothetical protein
MGRLYAPVPGLLRPGTLGACAPCTALSHNRVRTSSGPCATQGETPKESAAPRLRELTGGNSPHYTYQPTKTKTDRVLVKYILFSTRLRHTTHNLSNNPSSKECHSWNEETQLFAFPVARWLSNAAESI